MSPDPLHLEVLPAAALPADAEALLAGHRAWAAAFSPPEDVHALTPEQATGADLVWVVARQGGELAGVGALLRLDDEAAEVKGMHTAPAARGRGVARTVLAALLALAEERGVRRLLLETGTAEAFAPARALYEAHGFRPCPPYGSYVASPHSAFFRKDLAPREHAAPPGVGATL